MPVYTQLPISVNKAISTTDLFLVLKLRRRNTGDELNYANSNVHGKTNMWARFKPEAIGTMAPLAEAERKANNYGLVPSDNMRGYGPSMDATNGIPALSAVTWSYKAPGANNFMRISDWIGYEHNATAPTTQVADIEFPFNKQEIEISLTKPSIQTVNSLQLSDFGYCQDLYFCVVIWTKNRSTGKELVLNYKTAENKIGDTDALNRLSVKFSRSELTVAAGLDLHFTTCFSTLKVTSAINSGGINSTVLYPIVTNTPPTGQIIMSKELPFSFVKEGVAAAVGPYKINSLDLYAISPVGADGKQIITALGVHRGAGTIVYFGYFEGKGTGESNIAKTLLQGRLMPTLTGSRATVTPKVYLKDDSGNYTESQGSTLTIPSSGKVYVALEFRTIAYIPSDGASYVQPAVGTKWKYCAFNCFLTSPSSSDSTSGIFTHALHICPEYFDTDYEVSRLDESAS